MADRNGGSCGIMLRLTQNKSNRMTVRKEVLEKCEKMVEKQIAENQSKLFLNRREIARLAKEQRIMKAQIGVLYQMRNDLRPKKV